MPPTWIEDTLLKQPCHMIIIMYIYLEYQHLIQHPNKHGSSYLKVHYDKNDDL